MPPAAPLSPSRPGKKQRPAMPPALLKVIARWRNRIETTFSEITDRMELARHGARTPHPGACQGLDPGVLRGRCRSA
jgi:hypothetical protein